MGGLWAKVGSIFGREQRAGSAAPETRDSLKTPSDALLAALGVGTASGQIVNPERAMRCSGVWACVNLVGNLIGSLPARVYLRDARGPVLQRDHPANLVLQEPNSSQDALEFCAMQQTRVLLEGDGLAIIQRDNQGKPGELIPVTSRVHVARRKDTRALVYDIDGEGVFDSANVLHIRGPTMDGVSGMSPVRAMREALGVSLAAEEAAAGMFKNGMSPSLILETARSMNPQEYADFLAKLESLYAGTKKAGRPLLFDGGMQAKPVSLSADDMQFLETRRFQLAEIARIYGVPLHMIGETDKTTSWGSGLEQMTQGFISFSFGHWVRRWEQQLQRKLLTKAERLQGYYIRLSLQALLRGDTAARATFYKQMFEVGAFAPNKILELEDMELLPDAIGGMHYRPANMVPLQSAPQPSTQEATT